MPITSYKQLTVWQKSFELVRQVYVLTEKLPKHEQFGLSNQIRRCAVSIPSNIAEGQQRHSRKEYLQFLAIARGSAAELDTQLLLIESIYGLDCEKELSLLDEVQRMLTVLTNKLSAL